MKKISRCLLGLLIVIFLAGCNLPGDFARVDPSQEAEGEMQERGGQAESAQAPDSQGATAEGFGGSEEQTDQTWLSGEINYCDLPQNTRMTWFDLSTFIYIPQNSFQMGADDAEEDRDHEPSHTVQLGAYWMHETEVTNRQYANCVNAGLCQPPSSTQFSPYWFDETERLDDPVVGVSWEQADTYCEWIGARLPTEAEWELAARGVDAFLYPWGPDEPDCERANFEGCLTSETPQPVAVGSLPEGASPFGMLDMTGNVNEWVDDWYAEDAYRFSPVNNPKGPESGEERVWRGGGYRNLSDQLQTYLRNALEPQESRSDLGFRCALDCGSGAPPQMCVMPPIAGDVPSGYLPGGGFDIPLPEISLTGYCELREGVPFAGVVLTPPSFIKLDHYEFSSPIGTITCDPIPEGKLVCHGPAIQPDNQITIRLCPNCLPGFFFDPILGHCRPILNIDVSRILNPDSGGEDCGSGYIWINGLGCIPNTAVAVNCPPGYHYSGGCGCIPDGVQCLAVATPEPLELVEPTPVELAVVEPTPVVLQIADPNAPDEEPDEFIFPPVLMPVMTVDPGNLTIDPSWIPQPELPLDCDPNSPFPICPPNTFPLPVEGCWACAPFPFLPSCPAGFSQHPSANCCIPETPGLVCPPLTFFDPLTHSCIPIPKGEFCFEISVYVPPCPTPEPLGCGNPDQYQDEKSCENAGCKWNFTATGLGVCVRP